LITYGDDAKSSVKEGWDEFNHISVAKFLADRDMKFTMPDKESEPTEYMTDEDADLLKRKNVVNPETGLIMGALDEMSIFKSLHSVLRSKAVSNEEQCISNIDGALREWFAHGKDKYELRRAQMKEIAERAGIAHGCTQLDVTYEECVDRFCETYNVPLIAKLDNQCGIEPPLNEEQPCRGSAYDFHFWWEHVARYVSLVHILVCIFLLLTGRYHGSLVFQLVAGFIS
jgi:hypothetical protein